MNSKFMMKMGMGIRMGMKNRSYFALSKKAWFLRHVNDFYVKKANQMNFRSRACFKLLEIAKKYPGVFCQYSSNNTRKIQQLLNPDSRQKSLTSTPHPSSPPENPPKFLDLGSAPGSWSQILHQLFPFSPIVAIDLLEMQPIEGVEFYQKDARLKTLHTHLLQKYHNFSCIVSDMAPNFSGDRALSHVQILQLNTLCLKLCFLLGENGCGLVMKSLQGKYEKCMYQLLGMLFKKVNREKPESSRSGSMEFFYVCEGRKKVEGKEDRAEESFYKVQIKAKSIDEQASKNTDKTKKQKLVFLLQNIQDNTENQLIKFTDKKKGQKIINEILDSS